MRICGIVRGKRRTITTESDPSADRHPDLIDRQWNTPTRPDQWWVADFTYVWTLAGFCYVSFVVVVYSRRILGWRASMTRRSDLVLSTLEQAIHTRRRGSFADRIRGDVPFQPGDRTSDGLTQQDPPT
ncbi:DDE-type integrase/transposase/recombinase [Dietzia maris]|uniref:DDE-type integrase/transposase/recombinase n=1 Tax=Dietzia maris TaxID=37915 RepID=UPI003427B7C5